MSLGGVRAVCSVCDKAVYQTEKVTTGSKRADGTPHVYHRTCFKCFHCKTSLAGTSDYGQENGKVYCMQHYKECFRRKGKYDGLEASAATLSAAPSKIPGVKPCVVAGCNLPQIAKGLRRMYCVQHQEQNSERKVPVGPKRPSGFAQGLRFGSSAPKCRVCQKSAYPQESISTGDRDNVYHKTCFKCQHCGTALSLSSYGQTDGHVFCPQHFREIVGRKGHYDFGRAERPKARLVS